MNIVVEKQPKCVAILSVEIPADKAQAKREHIVRGYINKARLPGFRPGKAPKALVEKRYNSEILAELTNELVENAFDEMLRREPELKVINLGSPKDLTFHEDDRVTFVAELTLSPEFDLPEYREMKLTCPPAAVPESQVDRQISDLQQRLADFNNITDRASQMGDIVVIDYTTTVAGKPTEEFLGRSAGYLGGREGHWVKLDEKSFLPGAAEQMAGMNVGESREITITLPEDFVLDELQNQEMVMQLTLKEIKETVLPELDDAFAERFIPGKTMEELRDLIRTELQKQRDREISDHKVDKIIENLCAGMDFDVPEPLLQGETQNLADQMVASAARQGVSNEQIESDKENIFIYAAERAAHQLRSNFLLLAIAQKEEIRATDEELVNHLVAIATEKKISPKKLVNDMQRQGRLGSIRQSIVIGKTVDFLLEQAEFAEVESETPEPEN